APGTHVDAAQDLRAGPRCCAMGDDAAVFFYGLSKFDTDRNIHRSAKKRLATADDVTQRGATRGREAGGAPFAGFRSAPHVLHPFESRESLRCVRALLLRSAVLSRIGARIALSHP